MVERAIKLEKKPKDEGPERPADETQIGVSYLSFEDLQPFSEALLQNQESLVQGVFDLSKSEEWKA